MKALSGMIGTALLAFGISGPAHALTEQCNRCTALEMAIIAENRIDAIRTWGPLYIVDAKSGVVRKYEFRSNVTPETNPEFDPIYYWVEEVSPEPNISASVQELRIYAEKLQDQIVVNPGRTDLPADAHEAVSNTSFDLAIDRYIREMSPSAYVNQWADYLERMPVNEFFFPDSLYVSMELVYQDGSRQILRWNKATEMHERMPNTSRDGNNNIIPESRAQIFGDGTRTYTFDEDGPDNQDDFWDMYNLVSRFQVPIIVIGNEGPTGTRYSMTCAQDVCTIWVHQ